MSLITPYRKYHICIETFFFSIDNHLTLLSLSLFQALAINEIGGELYYANSTNSSEEPYSWYCSLNKI